MLPEKERERDTPQYLHLVVNGVNALALLVPTTGADGFPQQSDCTLNNKNQEITRVQAAATQQPTVDSRQMPEG